MLQNFNAKSTKVCVLGLGSIGLPLSCVLANANYQVLGVDVNPVLIADLMQGKINLPEPGLQDLLNQSIISKKFNVSIAIMPAAIFIIAVPTPITDTQEPDLSNLNSAIDAVIPNLEANNLVIIESTCPIGTTNFVAQKLRNIIPSIKIAFCSERVLPGNILNELIYNSRIIGGVDQASTLAAVAFYKTFIKGELIASTSKMAEAVKLVENSYRDVNIAFANELSMLCDQLNLNINELISYANKHPRVAILQPGIGVGGHCIPVDPYFLINANKQQTKLMQAAREINLEKKNFVLAKIVQAIHNNGCANIACLGLTYKADVADLRCSPALMIVEELKKIIPVFTVDPYVENTISLEEAIRVADLIVILVAHTCFKKLNKKLATSQKVLDFAGILQ